MSETAKAWLASVEERKRGKLRQTTRPPWEEMQWFETPTMSEFTNPNPAGLTVSVAPANSRRVVLILGCASGTGLYVSIRNDVAGATNGYQLLATTLPLIITQKDHGVLCQVEWFAFIPQFDVLDVTQVVLRDWP